MLCKFCIVSLHVCYHKHYFCASSSRAAVQQISQGVGQTTQQSAASNTTAATTGTSVNAPVTGATSAATTTSTPQNAAADLQMLNPYSFHSLPGSAFLQVPSSQGLDPSKYVNIHLTYLVFKMCHLILRLSSMI